MYKKFFKRFFDFALTLVGLVLFSPILLFLCILIRLKLGTPVFFTQVRIGKDEKPFKIIKFRTMTDQRGAMANFCLTLKDLQDLVIFFEIQALTSFLNCLTY